MQKKVGRPQAIPPALLPAVLDLYRQGLGYRRLANVLAQKHRLTVSWCSVRQAIKGKPPYNTASPLLK
jgi:hypothetical protein